jgi:signal transduction histidine kinase
MPPPPHRIAAPPGAEPDREREACRRLALVALIGREMHVHTLSLEALTQVIAERLGELIGDYCALRLLEADGETLRLAAFGGRDPAATAAAAAFFRGVKASVSGGPWMRRLLADGGVLAPRVGPDMLARLEAAGGALPVPVRSLMAVPLVARGRPIGVLTLLRVASPEPFVPEDLAMLEDIASRAALALDNAALLARLEQAVAARDEFIGLASHELRTPLTSAYLQVEMLQRQLARAGEPERERLVRGLAVVRGALERQNRLIGNLLDASRIQSGSLALERAPVALAAVVRRAAESLEAQRAAAGVVLRHEFLADPRGAWDAERLEQVCANLIGNALKYGEGKPVVLRVAAEVAHAVVQVRDGGPGVPAAQRQEIFARFNRGGRRDGNGLGLGLYIAAEIVRAHGGTLEAGAAPEGGAAFTVRLPLQ